MSPILEASGGICPGPKRKALTGRGSTGKTAVVAVRDRATNRVRARVVENTDKPTLQGFVSENSEPGTMVYTDEAKAYEGLPNHLAVKHSVGEYVKDMAHVNGVESFWSVLKRAHKGTFHRLSPKHLNRYIQEFSHKHNTRDLDTVKQMKAVMIGLVGRRLMYRDLIADTGLGAMAQEG